MELRRRSLEIYLSCLREWGDCGVDLESWLLRLESQLQKRASSLEQTDLQEHYLAEGLLRGNDNAFRILFREKVPGILKAGRRAGYRRSLVEEEWQALVAQLPQMESRSPLLAYTGRGSLGGFLRVVLLRRLGRRVARDSCLEDRVRGHSKRVTFISPSVEAQILEAERLRLATDLVHSTMRHFSRGERLFLHFHHALGLPLTKAAVRAKVLPPEQSHLRTAASRLHQRLLRRFREWVIEVAQEEFDLDPGSVEGLLESSLKERDSVLKRGDRGGTME